MPPPTDFRISGKPQVGQILDSYKILLENAEATPQALHANFGQLKQLFCSLPQILWVNAGTGNDTTAVRGLFVYQYATVGAAMTASHTGDTVIVLNGVYSEQLVLKHGVNVVFLSGARLSVGSPAGVGTSFPLITDAGVPVTCSVSIDTIEAHGKTSSGNVIKLTGGGVVDVYFKDIIGGFLTATGSGPYMIDVTGTTLRLHGNRISAVNKAQGVRSGPGATIVYDISDAVDLSNGTTTAITVLGPNASALGYINKVLGAGGNPNAFLCDGGGTDGTNVLDLRVNYTVGGIITQNGSPARAMLTGTSIFGGDGPCVYSINPDSGIILKNCILQTNGTFSIDGDPTTVTFYGRLYANALQSGNITFLVETPDNFYFASSVNIFQN